MVHLCPQCRTTGVVVRKILNEMSLSHEIKIITDTTEWEKVGVTGTPALEIGGKIIVMGRMARAKEIREGLKELEG